MIFKDVLLKHEAIIRPEFQRLVETAFERQSHPGDLLIWHNNGFYDESYTNFTTSDGKRLNPHVIGPGDIGHSEQAHYKFIHQYRQAYFSKISFEDYLKSLSYSPENSAKIDELVEFEETTINLELLVYLKFWEADNIIKKFYELVRILYSEPYDWYFKVMESSRDTNSTGTRQDIIRKLVRDRLKDEFPGIYNAVKTSYKTQIRNAIAHSKYSFQGRNIHINNYIKEDPHAQIRNIPFDEWIDIFHLTIVLHNEYIRADNYIKDRYAEIALNNGNVFPIKITEPTKSYEFLLQYRPEWGDWGYKQP